MKSVKLVLIFTVLVSLDFCYGKTRIKSFTRDVLRQEKTRDLKTENDLLLVCETEGTPSTIQIKKLQDEAPLILSNGREQNVTYLMPNVTCDNAGIYECLTDNMQRKTVGVMPLDCPPMLCQDKEVNKTIFVKVNDTVDISLCVLTYAEILNYISINNSKLRKKASNLRWTWDMEENKSNTIFIKNYSITIKFSNITIEDYGVMRVQVFSGAGSQYYLDYHILLHPPGPPECPKELKVVNYGLDYIMLSWQPGLDGGCEQSFNVFISKDAASWSRCYTTNNETSGKITGLLENTNYFFRVVSSSELRRTVNASFCENTTYGKTDMRPYKENQETLLTYLPPFVVVVVAVILTVIATIRKEKKLKKKMYEEQSSMETIISNSSTL